MTEIVHIAVASVAPRIHSIPSTRLPTSDISISCELHATLVRDLAETVGFTAGPLLIDGRSYPGSTTLAEAGLVSGSVIANPAEALRDLSETPPVVAIRVIAGPTGGRSQHLNTGRYRLSSDWTTWETTDSASGLTITVDTDAVIIGAGIVGASCAYHLAKEGWRDIVILDKGQLPHNDGSTSHAPGGVVVASHSKLPQICP